MNNFTNSTIECEKENEFIYKFNGQLKLNEDLVVGLGEEQILLRGSSLRNTGHIWGVAIYTGHDSKVMMNSSKGVVKKSKLEITLNKYILMGMTIQFILCLFAAIWSSTWTYAKFRNDNVGPQYLQLLDSYEISATGKLLSDNSSKTQLSLGFVVYETFISLGKWILALMNFVSISLLVSLETVKFW